MASYSSSEKIIANFLSKFPRVKSTIKKLYSTVNYYVYKKKFTYESDYNITEVVSSDTTESFFGYYDKSPANRSNTHILYQEIEDISTSQLPDPTKSVNIVLFDINAKKYLKIASSSAYNWQQGSKPQWLSDSKFIYNDFDGDNYISKIYDIKDHSFKTINFPIYDCYKNEYALSLDFNRLNNLNTDYGYKNIILKPDLEKTENDGIFYIDLKTDSVKLLIPLKKVIDLHPKDNMNGAQHTFNHIMLSPDGKNFIFIHRWYRSGERFDSLILSNIEGTKISVLADEDVVCHCCWYDDATVMGFFRDNSHGDSFYKIDISSGNIKLLSAKLLEYGDGHPSFYKNKMLFDSYPDRSRMQHLYTYDMKKDKIKELGSFISPLRYYGENRCDLHPKWSFNGKDIFIDSAYDGKRKLYMMQYL